MRKHNNRVFYTRKINCIDNNKHWNKNLSLSNQTTIQNIDFETILFFIFEKIETIVPLGG
jgi:hypothetical protein